MRQISFAQAILEATEQCMHLDSSVVVFGLGVPDPKGIFGTTKGLSEKFGRQRVLDVPIAENAMTGIALGASLAGIKPIIVHQRVEFALLALDQIVNQAAKWSFMFPGQNNCSIVIRLIVGRGWGTGPQHTQSLESWFGHIPGLTVVMPATPFEAKGQLIKAIIMGGVVIFIEHRWLHSTIGDVPEAPYSVALSGSYLARQGMDFTIVTYSYGLIEVTRAATYLKEKYDIEVEVIVLRSIRPLEIDRISNSVKRTRALLIFEIGWTTYGVGAEIISRIVCSIKDPFRCEPIRVGLHDVPIPSAHCLASSIYPSSKDIVSKILESLERKIVDSEFSGLQLSSDVPDENFLGPF
jgi:pyruvate dehydrogenase E1 component beta subunit